MPFVSSFRNTTRTNQRVPQGLTNVRPAPNAITIKTNYPNATDGLYFIRLNPSNTDGTKRYYCDMTNAGGGWMLAAKIDTASNGEWGTGGSWWSTGSEVNPANTLNLNDNDGVADVYYNYTAQTGIRMCAGTLNNALQLNVSGQTARALTTTPRGTGFGRSAWINWFGGGSHQDNCNREGFLNSEGQFGIGFNNEGDCNTNDTGISIGRFSGSLSGSGGSSRPVFIMVR